MAGSTAARWEGWRLRGGIYSTPNVSYGPGSASGDVQNAVKVELQIGGTWTDITTYVYYRDKIHITRGTPDETTQWVPSTCTFTVNNADGRFSPRKADGPWYGQFGRNSPIRVSKFINGNYVVRFVGEVSDLPIKWDITATDVYVPLVASGVLRRLNQGNAPTDSTMRQGMLTDNPIPRAYWTMEDAAGATQLLPSRGTIPLTITGTPTLSSFTSFDCSKALPVMGSAKVAANIPAYTSTNAIQIRFLLAIPAAGATNGQTVCRFTTTGTATTWRLLYGSAAGGTLQLIGTDTTGATIADTGVWVLGNGNLSRVSLELHTVAGTTTGGLVFWNIGSPTGTVASFTPYAGSTGSCTRIILAYDQGLTNTAMGHLSLQDQVTSVYDVLSQLQAYKSETVANRLVRLFLSKGITCNILDRSAFGISSVALGSQLPSTFIDLMNECVTAELGILYEKRDELAINFRKREDLYNQVATVILDYNQHQLADSLNPIDDDQSTRNDYTVSRVNGSSTTATLDSGPMSTQAPPFGVGRVTTQDTISAPDDTTLADQANWRLWVATVNEARYPTLAINLKNQAILNNVTLSNAIVNMDIGDKIQVTNPPNYSAIGTISQIVRGYSESFDQFEHTMVLNCSPESPYEVGVLNDTILGHLDTDGSVTTGPVGTTDTTFIVATSNTTSPAWIATATDTTPTSFPFDVMIGGERMTVTSIVGTDPAGQIFHVTRSVNGVVKVHPALGEAVSLAQPMIISL